MPSNAISDECILCKMGSPKDEHGKHWIYPPPSYPDVKAHFPDIDEPFQVQCGDAVAVQIEEEETT
jgi:hypothetical protein